MNLPPRANKFLNVAAWCPTELDLDLWEYLSREQNNHFNSIMSIIAPFKKNFNSYVWISCNKRQIEIDYWYRGLELVSKASIDLGNNVLFEYYLLISGYLSFQGSNGCPNGAFSLIFDIILVIFWQNLTFQTIFGKSWTWKLYWCKNYLMRWMNKLD